MSAASRLTPETMTKDERSFLVYAESCCVDYGGLLESIRMNDDDFHAAIKFELAGLMRFGRMPARLLGSSLGRTRTHYAELTEAGWVLAHECRRLRSKQRGPLATDVFQWVSECEEIAAEGRSNG